LWREGLRPRVLIYAKGNGISGRQGLLAVGRGAAHSNTQEKRDKLRNGFLDCRESTEGKGDGSETRETDKRRNLGLPSVAPSLL